MRERQEADKLYASKEGKKELEEVKKRAKTFVPGAMIPNDRGG